jgi:hypothetical protein
MKAKMTLIVLAVALFSNLLAQTPFAEFNLESNNIDDVQAFEVGDSVFLTFTESKASVSTKKGFWIIDQQVQNEMALNHIAGLPFCGIIRNDGKVFYYYLYGDRSLKVKWFTQSITNSTISPGKADFNVPGKLVSVNTIGNKIVVISYLEAAQEFTVQDLKGESVKNRTIKISFDISKYLKTSSGLITGSDLTTFGQGSAKLKIYTEGDDLVITVDDPFVKNNSKTTVIKLNFATGKETMFTIAGPDDDQFASFYDNEKLYRLIMSPVLWRLDVHDIHTGNTLHSKSIKREKSLEHNVTVQRIERTNQIFYSDLNNLIQRSRDADPAIIVQRTDGDDVRVFIGTFFNDKDPGSFSGIGSNPLLGIVAFIITRSIGQLREPPGVSDYISLIGSPAKGFEFESIRNNNSTTAPSIRRVIDTYELKKETDVKSSERWSLFLQFKGYAELKNGALGVYQEKRNRDKKLVLLKYEAKEKASSN